MLAWLENYGKTHLFYIILIVMGVVSFRCWLSEHDARVLAEQTVKQSDARVKDLQQQITNTNTEAAQKVQTVVKIVHDAQTPSQVVAAIPSLTNVPLNARTLPDLGPTQVAVDAQPLVQVLGQCKQDSINLGACQANYNTCQQIVTQREEEIKELKKGPGFFHRVVGVAKAVGVGVGIGILIGGHL
jgi:hypothetical protein